MRKSLNWDINLRRKSKNYEKKSELQEKKSELRDINLELRESHNSRKNAIWESQNGQI